MTTSTFQARRHRIARLLATIAAAGSLAATIALAGIVPIASVAASTPACRASQLSARVTGGDAGAGSRFTTIRLYNTSFTTCYVRNFPQVRLVSGTGHTMIGGHAASTTGKTHSIAPLHYLSTEVQTSNYCGGAYAKPVTFTFTLTGTLGRVVAIPLSTTSVVGVPPCFGSPGDPGVISMHAWS